MFPKDWLRQAEIRIKPYLYHTDLLSDPEQQIHLKLENRQVTGSFKARGALNKVLSLSDWELARGIVAASAGNHGQGVAYAGRIVKARVTVFCSEHAVPTKIQAMRDLGAQVKLVPGGYGEAEKAGIDYAKSEGCIWISPYNDSHVIAGQGTVAIEILDSRPELAEATWIVPASGGGLISGIGSVLKDRSSKARLVAVQSAASPFLHDLYTKGTQEAAVELPSIADGLAGPVEEGSLTIPLVKSLVDEFILVSEEEIERAIAFAWHRAKEVIEGSAAAPLAAIVSGRISHRPAVLILSGGNIQPESHQAIIQKYGGTAA
jgi:threonine dehydratase